MIATRRSFMRSTLGAGAALAVGSLMDDWNRRVQAAVQEVAGRPAEEVAANESFWFQIQQAFTLDRSLINLNNGGVCPSPRIVVEAHRRHLDYANMAPSRHLWDVQDKQVELVRTRLAKAFGCDREELAITRGASEALQIALNGIDLKPGDEILTTTHDYPRMVNTIKQRALREGVVLKQFSPPIPPKTLDDLTALFEKNVTPRTKVILLSQVVNITGQIYPVRDVCRMARQRNIRTIVDGAHAFAHFPFKCSDLECDYYGTSLHKWLTAPIGTGFLYVHKDLIADHWPMTAAPDPKADDIRKFEEIGTHPAAERLAVAEALTFWEGIGPERKAARMRYLRDAWAKRLAKHDRVRWHTNMSPEHSCGLAVFEVDGIDPAKIVGHLWDRHKIIVTGIQHDEFRGVRVTPNVYTTMREIELFSEAMEDVIRNGLPT